MKNSILTVLAVATLVACKKNETTKLNTATDSSAMMPATDSSMMPADSTTMTNTSATTLSDMDKKFADKAAMGGMMEVSLGEYAEMNGTNAMVKDLGKMMKEDHSKANNELKSWATSAGYTLPATLDQDMQKKVDDLKAKKGADFDKAYTDMMVSDHKEDISLFKDEAAKGGDSNLKSFASKTLPTLEHHLTKSEEAKSAVK
ncbi:DUF4142 domain-containing protein [Kaistella palustris]|uniref:DUF4142 domain-containing protein n=1 Tax=Kaistella palustris TaxID=493376 RepID=UPI00041561F3|nr:DUF4142 domain-containing protein [Kaistella palustris]